jgi:hypothetical protein
VGVEDVVAAKAVDADVAEIVEETVVDAEIATEENGENVPQGRNAQREAKLVEKELLLQDEEDMVEIVKIAATGLHAGEVKVVVDAAAADVVEAAAEVVAVKTASSTSTTRPSLPWDRELKKDAERALSVTRKKYSTHNIERYMI